MGAADITGETQYQFVLDTEVTLSQPTAQLPETEPTVGNLIFIPVILK